MRAAALLLLVASARAQAPDVPHGGGACATDLDCSLGGACAASSCACDIWWTGPQCDLLNLQRADPAARGLVSDSYFSWGGHALRDETGTYHLLASFLCDHATLGQWTTKSSIAHATSAAPAGPFVLAPGLDAQLVVPPWSHGAYVVRDPPTGEYLLVHIGDGRVPKSTWAPCYNSSEDTPAFAAAAAAAAAAAPDEPLGAGALANDGVFVERSMSLEGPWTSFANNTGLVVNYPADSWTHGITNPALYIFENGTTLLYYRADDCPKGWGLAPACIGVAIADSWQGPYMSIGSEPITHPEAEDPAVFRDPRGNFHMLTNVRLRTIVARRARRTSRLSAPPSLSSPAGKHVPRALRRGRAVRRARVVARRAILVKPNHRRVWPRYSLGQRDLLHGRVRGAPAGHPGRVWRADCLLYRLRYALVL